MSENFNTNIDNYTDKELLDILELNDHATQSLIEKKINIIYNKLLQNNEYDFLKFFQDMKNRLLKDSDFSETTNLSSENEINDYYDNYNIIKEDKFNNNRTIPLEVNRDNINPNFRQINNCFILIDSKDRNIITPFNKDPNSPSSSTQFTCNLTSTIHNVVNIRLNSIYIPKTYTNISNIYSNNYFEIIDICNNNTKRPIIIPDGNYNIDNLINIINELLITNDVSNIKFSLVSQEDISLNQENIKEIIGYNKFIKIQNNSDKEYIIIFYDKFSNTYNNLNTFLSKNYYTNTLGYYLGFRFYDKNLLLNNIPDYWAIKLKSNENYISQTVYILNNLRYFRLCIDDYQNNQVSSSLVTIQRTDNKLKLPEYISKLDLEKQNDASYNIYTNENNKEYYQYVPEYPRKLTLNQLQSINSILLEQKTENNREYIFNNQNVLAIINIDSELTSNKNFISINNIDKDSTIIRKYFGPVNIDKLKISLYDNNGFLVNLNGHDWNFTLHVEQLYKY